MGENSGGVRMKISVWAEKKERHMAELNIPSQQGKLEPFSKTCQHDGLGLVEDQQGQERSSCEGLR